MKPKKTTAKTPKKPATLTIETLAKYIKKHPNGSVPVPLFLAEVKRARKEGAEALWKQITAEIDGQIS